VTGTLLIHLVFQLNRAERMLAGCVAVTAIATVVPWANPPTLQCLARVASIETDVDVPAALGHKHTAVREFVIRSQLAQSRTPIFSLEIIILV
jgi:hypothetical protein